MPAKHLEKPIAVITDSISKAIDAVMELHDIREVRGAGRTLTGKDGQKYIIITEVEQLKGLEIKGTLVIPGAAKNPNYSEIYDYARTRIK